MGLNQNIIFLLMVIFCGVRCSVYNKLESSAQQNIKNNFPSSSTECGGVLQGDSGVISYKPYSRAFENERCVWTIRTRNATGYRVFANSLGLSYSVIVSAVTSSGALDHQVPSGASSTATFLNGTAVVITFYTTNVTGNGFSLSYNAYSYDGSGGNTSQDVVAAADIGHIKHPINAETIVEPDLSVFVFLPTCVGGDKKTTEVIYIRDAPLRVGCSDKLVLYRFDPTLGNSNKWNPVGQLCSSIESETISSPDLILIVFSSDSSNVHTGFHLYSINI